MPYVIRQRTGSYGPRAYFAGWGDVLPTRWVSRLEEAETFSTRAKAQDVVRGLDPDRAVDVLTLRQAQRMED